MKRILLSTLIGVVLASGAGLAQADTSTASSGSWTAALSQLMACVTFGPMACVHPTPDNPGDPVIHNK